MKVETAIQYRLRRTLHGARSLFVKDSWSKKALNLSYHFSGEVELVRDGIMLVSLGITVPRNSFEYILDSYHHLRNLKNRIDANFYFEADLFFVEIGKIKLNLATAEEALIANEIFLAGIYQLLFGNRYVLLDIGMNVGFASMFFAAKPEVLKVYAFEPFRRTFDQALRNLENNPELRKKIQCFNYGLDGQSRTLTVDFNYENKGQVGIYGTALIRSKIGSVNKVDIVMKEASSEVKRILADHPGEALILKIDCEGAEYAIVENLFSNDLLHRIRILCIEWHEQGPGHLIDLLTRSGFTMFSQQSPTKKVGMIYAIK